MTIHNVNGSLPSLANCDKDSLLLSAKLLMADEFTELDVQSRREIAPVKLYLNNRELLVASKQTDPASEKPKVTYLRTHMLSEVVIERDTVDSSCMCVSEHRERYLYKLDQGEASMALWMSRISRPCLVRSRSEEALTSCTSRSGGQPAVAGKQTNGLLPQSSVTTSYDDQLTDSACPDVRISIQDDEMVKQKSIAMCRRSAEWHGETIDQALMPPLVDSEGGTTTSKKMLLQHQRRLSDAVDMEGLLRERRRSLSVPTDHPAGGSDKYLLTESAENDSKPISTPNSGRRKFKLPQSVTRFLSNAAPSPVRRPSLKKKKAVEEGTTPATPVSSLKPKSPGSLLRSFRKRFSSNGLRISPSFDPPSPSTEHPLRMMDEPDGHWMTDKLYLENAEEVAQQLCLNDSELLDLIDSRELENCAWIKKTKHETSPNVLQMIESFNKLALLVATEILSETTAHKRAKAISSYIQVASKCYKLHNYNSLNAVLAALQSASVYRLQKSWKLVSARRMRKFRLLVALMSTDNNWGNYRADLQKHQRRKAYCIPFFGEFLTALSQENSREYYDARQPRRGWDHSPVATSNASNLFKSKISGTSISLPDIACSLEVSTMDYPEPLHALRLLPLTSSQSASDIHKLSESSIISDGHQPTRTTLTDISQNSQPSSKQRLDSTTWESLDSSQNSVTQKKPLGLADDSALADSAIAMECDPKQDEATSNDTECPYQLSTIELTFEDKDEDTVFNGSFLSSDGDPSTISLNAISAEPVSSDDEPYEDEDSDDEEELEHVFQCNPDASAVSKAGLLFVPSLSPDLQSRLHVVMSDSKQNGYDMGGNFTPEQEHSNTTSSEPSLPSPDLSEDRHPAGHNRSYSDGTPLSPPLLGTLKTLVSAEQSELQTLLHPTTPYLILLNKYQYFSRKYQTVVTGKPRLRHVIKNKRALSENELFSLSCKREPLHSKNS